MPRDTAWRDALILAPGRVAGFRVRPLSAWHMHALQMAENPCADVWSDRGPTPGDLCDAIAICRSRARRIPRLIVAGRGLRAALWLRWQFVDWRRDARATQLHLGAYTRRPEIVPLKDRDGNPLGRPMGCPPWWAIAVDVASQMPAYSLRDCLNMPLCLLQTIRLALHELQGGARCAWGEQPDTRPDEIAEGLRRAQEAIDRHLKARAG
jgi:hypothetical protein